MAVMGTTTSPQDFPGYPQLSSDESGVWTHTERYWVATDQVYTTLPSHQSTTNQHGETITDPDGLTLECQTREISAGSAPGISVVELVYSVTEYTPKQPSDNPRRLSLRAQEIPIDDKRLLSTNGGKWTQTQIDEWKSQGYTSLPVYQVEYVYTDADTDYTWSEENITDSIQDTGTPDGITGATASKWRLVGREVSENESETVIESVWEFNDAGFVPLDS